MASTAPGSRPSCSVRTCASSSTRRGLQARSPATSPSRTRALVATSVAVSNSRISTRKNALFQGFFVAFQHDQSTCLPYVLQTHARHFRRQKAGPRVGPFDEHDGILEV